MPLASLVPTPNSSVPLSIWPLPLRSIASSPVPLPIQPTVLAWPSPVRSKLTPAVFAEVRLMPLPLRSRTIGESAISASTWPPLNTPIWSLVRAATCVIERADSSWDVITII